MSLAADKILPTCDDIDFLNLWKWMQHSFVKPCQVVCSEDSVVGSRVSIASLMVLVVCVMVYVYVARIYMVFFHCQYIVRYMHERLKK